jgi:hypothetical protein
VSTDSTLCGYVDMLKGLLTNEQMLMQKLKMEKCLLHLACKNSHNGVFSIFCMVFNLLFIYFTSWIINCINLWDFLQLCKYYVEVICTKGKKEHMQMHIMSLVMIK